MFGRHLSSKETDDDANGWNMLDVYIRLDYRNWRGRPDRRSHRKSFQEVMP